MTRSDVMQLVAWFLALCAVVVVTMTSCDTRDESTKPPAPQCQQLSDAQFRNASIAFGELQALGATDKEMEDAFIAAWTETEFVNYANSGSGKNGELKKDQDGGAIAQSREHLLSDGLPSEAGMSHDGDHGSLGIFQQQFPWWGTIDELMNPATATRKFVEKYRETGGNDKPTPRAIQDVQQSAVADGSNYKRGEFGGKCALKAVSEAKI